MLKRLLAAGALVAVAAVPVGIGTAAYASTGATVRSAHTASGVHPDGWTPYASYGTQWECQAAVSNYPAGWAFCAYSEETYSWLLWVYVS